MLSPILYSPGSRLNPKNKKIEKRKEKKKTAGNLCILWIWKEPIDRVCSLRQKYARCGCNGLTKHVAAEKISEIKKNKKNKKK